MEKLEKWELDFKWLEIRHSIKDAMKKKKLPDLNTILLLIGVQEVGIIKPQFTKEEKQDLMHVAVCTLMSDLGYYRLAGKDEEGWPVWEHLKPIEVGAVGEQATLLKEQIIKYFNNNNNQQNEEI